MNRYKLKYKPLGSIAVLIEWPKAIEEPILKNISIFRSKIHADMGEYVLETVPAYNSLTVFFDTTKIKYSGVVADLKEIYSTKDQKLLSAYKLWKIPVCYDPGFAPDLKEISQHVKLSAEEVIKRHSSVVYDVYFIGFLPGFLYLGGLDEKIHYKRRDKPRREIRSGDVGIAGNQTGIYPRVSPGGWNIIGNSPLKFFDVNGFPPCFAVAGDKVQFVPIDMEEHAAIREEVEKGTYVPKSKVYG
jgi:inhibitor of KinA